MMSEDSKVCFNIPREQRSVQRPLYYTWEKERIVFLFQPRYMIKLGTIYVLHTHTPKTITWGWSSHGFISNVFEAVHCTYKWAVNKGGGEIARTHKYLPIKKRKSIKWAAYFYLSLLLKLQPGIQTPLLLQSWTTPSMAKKWCSYLRLKFCAILVCFLTFVI